MPMVDQVSGSRGEPVWASCAGVPQQPSVGGVNREHNAELVLWQQQGHAHTQLPVPRGRRRAGAHQPAQRPAARQVGSPDLHLIHSHLRLDPQPILIIVQPSRTCPHHLPAPAPHPSTAVQGLLDNARYMQLQSACMEPSTAKDSL